MTKQFLLWEAECQKSTIMDDDKLLKPAASHKPVSTPSLDQAVDNFVEKFGHACEIFIFQSG